MFIPHKSVLLVMLAAAIFGCGTHGREETAGNSPNPEQTVRAMFAAEWSANADSSWALFHPVWLTAGFQGNFSRYANELERMKETWKDSPRSIVRIKTFPGPHTPRKAQAYVDKVGYESHEFAVVRAEILYPPAEGSAGGVSDYLITLAREKRKGAGWKIINMLTNDIVSDLFAW